ncbi:hypothetical protein ASD64_18265 [Mesorhizobium sp. Root157]|uniref:hypothetical protein n=1 Tax=Mesorhizobium sp. Root157 TaxID=1736477 RepID=UPI0006FEAD52|nr:hypothetical protein [Mesorhizobium sp. Root157]KQZ96098.1 hypothetical protein ASD64_18265 [Mesorhizobium sp. Root157]
MPSIQDDIPQDFKELCISAFSLALEADGAPQRCSRRFCHRTGQCHLPMGDNGPGACGAGPIPGRVAAEAALMLAFRFEE